MRKYKIKIPGILSTSRSRILFFSILYLLTLPFVVSYSEEKGSEIFLTKPTGGTVILERINLLLGVVEGRYSSDNKKSDAYLELGDIHTNNGRIQEAFNYYLSAYYYARTNKRRLTALMRLSDINYYYGSLGKAIEFAKEATEIAPGDIFLRKKLASYYLAAELWKPAVVELRKILKISGNNDKDAIFYIAVALERLGLYSEAIDNYKKLLIIGGYSPTESRSIKRRLASCYEKNSDFALAEALLKESLSGADDTAIPATDSSASLVADYCEGYMALGRLYYSHSDYKNASEAFSSAIKFAIPTDGRGGTENASARYESLVMTAVSYIKSGRYEEALELLKIVGKDENYTISVATLTYDTNNWNAIAHFLSGVAFYKMGDYKSASSEFSRAASSDTDSMKKSFVSGIASEFNNYCQSKTKSSPTPPDKEKPFLPILLEPQTP